MPLAHDSPVYKQTPQGELTLHLFRHTGAAAPVPQAAIVFFFGGGWQGGTPKQFFPFCERLAPLGIVAAAAEYRVRSRHGVAPPACVADGKSAVRYLRRQAGELGIDPDRIVAGGGSAGGHVAACTGIIEGQEDHGEDGTVSSHPNGLVLFNPVLDTSAETGFGAAAFGGRELDFSPLHAVRAGLPPTILYHGTADGTAPFASAERFQEAMRSAGNGCELVAFPDRGHGFFNHGREDNRDFEATLSHTVRFLKAQGCLPG